jgi:short-subunit dehydrogenase
MSEKTLIIVGMGPGISNALARRFAADGNKLGLIARSGDRLAAQTEELRADGATVASATADAGRRGELTAAIERLGEELGPVDVLIYNAYAATSGTPGGLAPDAFAGDLAVNAVGALEAAQALLPAMQARGTGQVLFTGGGLGVYPAAQAASLSVGKAALRTLAMTLNQETQGTGVYVGTLTIGGYVGSSAALQPDAIAEVFHRVATAPPTDGHGETWVG